MTFDPDAQFDPDRVSTGGGPGRGLLVGGGLGGILLVVAALLFGVDPSALLGGGSGSGAPGRGTDVSRCTSGQAANTDVTCRIVATTYSLDDVWGALLPAETGARYTRPRVQLFSGSVQTGCGAATTAVGPFYCPADTTAYFDTGFFRVLVDRFGASGGPLAQEYVVAHEFGHHIQDELGILRRVQADPAGAQSASVRSELQADCFAGVWAAHASTTPDPQTGRPFLEPITEADIADALSAAASVGDDRIQRATQGRTDPETYTHGTSAQRQRWFTSGYRGGTVGSCDTFSAASL